MAFSPTPPHQTAKCNIKEEIEPMFETRLSDYTFLPPVATTSTPIVSEKRRRDELDDSDPAEEDHLKEKFLQSFLPPEKEFGPDELIKRQQLLHHEQELYEKFLQRANIEYPMQLSYHDNKARKNVAECNCLKRNCKKCKRLIQNQKSLESRYKAQIENRNNLFRILFLQERIAKYTLLEQMMKKMVYQGQYDKFN